MMGPTRIEGIIPPVERGRPLGRPRRRWKNYIDI
jgi:hypothetical protein